MIFFRRQFFFVCLEKSDVGHRHITRGEDGGDGSCCGGGVGGDCCGGGVGGDCCCCGGGKTNIRVSKFSIYLL